MSFDANQLVPTGLDSAFVDLLIEEHVQNVTPDLERLWSYYRNDLTDAGTSSDPRRYRLAQEQGLPPRLTVTRPSGTVPFDVRPSEVVIENDIGWRIHTLADFMFGKPITIQSMAPQPELAANIDVLLRAVFDANGGIGFFHDLALLGSVYGYVDVLLQAAPTLNELAGKARRQSAPDPTTLPTPNQLMELAHGFVLEVIDAPRAVPVLNPDDYRRLDGFIIHYRQLLNQVEEGGLHGGLGWRVLANWPASSRRSTIERTHVWTDSVALTFEGTPSKRSLTHEAVNRLGRIPLVHIQNLPQPFFYEGLSEVESLIPLQDELNTRLSDRANRVTFQSFKMYLGKCIDKFTEHPVGPGQMWSTDNPEASIEEFGGDGESPSEDAHINEIREAMDKTSGVTALAAGLLRNKVGNLTSENALRIVMMGLLARTEKKRVTYGAGIERLCELILHAADVFGVLATRPQDRRVRLNWPNPLPADESQRLRDAKLKIEIGVPVTQVLTELGYGECIAQCATE